LRVARRPHRARRVGLLLLVSVEALVTYLSVNRRGQTQRDQRRVTGPVIHIGRASGNEIQLRDARVGLEHARITLAADGATMEAVDGPVEVNGHAAGKAGLEPGDRLRIGPYEIKVEAPTEGV